MSDLTPITREEALLDGADLEPITRKEQFIKRIYDKTQEIPEPITREEWFLKKAGEGGGGVTVEQLNATENGTYSEQGKAYSPVIVEVPQTTVESLNITANGTYTAPSGKAYSPVTVNVEGFKKKSIANTPTDIASFNDGTANPMPSLEISIEPQQDLHGYDNPWVGGSGKNKFDATLMVNPSASAQWLQMTLSANTQYTISSSIPYSATSAYIFCIGGTDTSSATSANSGAGLNAPRTVTSDNNGIISVGYRNVGADGTLDLANYAYQIESGSTATSFAPYSNICPISGWDEAQITVADDLTTPTETHTTSIPFRDSSDNPITVYGGTLNVTTGELTPTMASVDMGTLTWANPTTDIFNVAIPDMNTEIKNKIMCSIYPLATNSFNWASVASYRDQSISTAGNNYIYVKDSRYSSVTDFKTAMNGVQLVYKLTTPQTYQLTPTQVTTLLGQNNIFADCGQVLEGEYFVTL